MSEDNKPKDKKVGNYLFQGDWVEKDGIKWAFFADELKTADYSPEELEKEIKKEQSREIKKEDSKIIKSPEPSEKISITDIGKQYIDNRYGKTLSSNLIPPGILKADTILSGRYKIVESHKSLEKSDFYQVSDFYYAMDTRLETLCIVKELRGDISADREYYRKRFKEEAKILADLSHPNLPKVIDYFIESERYFMVIDYIKGFQLDDLINNKEINITEEQVLLWGIDICDVLEYLHRQKPPIIHRDIRPANLFIRESDWTVILFNFNVARRQETKCTTGIGLMGYASPEQIAGRPEPRSDIYSLGATLHHILTGETTKVPFQFKPVREINPSVSEYTELVIKQALGFKLDERFDNAEEMKEALLDAYESLPQKVSEEDNGTWTWDPLLELAEMLKKDGYKKIKAIKEISALKDPRALKYLLPLLEDESIVIKVNTIHAIETLGAKEAIPCLEKLREDKSKEIREKAIKAIDSIMNV